MKTHSIAVLPVLGVSLTVSMTAVHAEEYSATTVPNPPAPPSNQSVFLSSDGKTLAGTTYLWTPTDGSLNIAGPAGSTSFEIRDLSGDGGSVVGKALFSSGIRTRAFIRDISGGLAGPVQDLAPLPAINLGVEANGVSDDGGVVVGEMWNSSGKVAAVWERGSSGYTVKSLGDLAGGTTNGEATAVNGDGTVIVGTGTGNGYYEAARWTKANPAAPWQIQGLGSLTAGNDDSFGIGLSDDGATVVGRARNSVNVIVPFRWTQATGMQDLGSAPGTSGAARAASRNGSVIVGDLGGKAFRWTQATGVQELKPLLEAEGVDLTGFDLKGATSITPDGRIIAGYGQLPASQTTYIAVYDPTVTAPPPAAPPPAAAPAAGASSSPSSGAAPTVPTAGIVAVQDFTQSAASTSGASQFTGQAGRSLSGGMSNQVLNLPIGQQQLGFFQAPTRFGGFVFGQGRQLLGSARDQARMGAGGAGLTMTMPGGLVLGVSALAMRQDFTASTLGSTVGLKGQGGAVFARYAPSRGGVQLMFSASMMQLSSDIDRRYMNGARIETASGSTTGQFRDVQARAGYGLMLGRGTSLTPYVQLSRSNSSFKGYSETGGMFAGAVSAQTSQQTTAQVGADWRKNLSSKLQLNAVLAVSQTQETGQFANVSVGVLNGTRFGGGAVARSFGTASASFGVNYAVSNAVTLSGNLSVNKGLRGVRDVDDGAVSIGMSFSF